MYCHVESWFHGFMCTCGHAPRPCQGNSKVPGSAPAVRLWSFVFLLHWAPGAVGCAPRPTYRKILPAFGRKFSHHPARARGGALVAWRKLGTSFEGASHGWAINGRKIFNFPLRVALSRRSCVARLAYTNCESSVRRGTVTGVVCAKQSIGSCGRSRTAWKACMAPVCFWK
jgi:hypothetical protein